MDAEQVEAVLKRACGELTQGEPVATSLDTGVLMAAARNTINLAELPDDDDPALPAIAVAEYLAGVHLDPDTGRQTTRRRFLDDILAAVPVEDYTPAVAEYHAELLAHTRRVGEPRGARTT